MSAQRQCGDCSLCCKTQSIAALDKPAGKWCEHCRPGRGGCAIYQGRPSECAAYSCAWLSGLADERLKPNRVHAVVGANLDQTAIVVHLDPGYPGAADAEPLASEIRRWATTMPVLIACGPRRRLVWLGRGQIDVRDPATGRIWLRSGDDNVQVAKGI